MKKLLPVILLLCLVATVCAAFISTEPFTNTAGTDLNGTSGGTNWTSNWTGTAATWSIQTAPSGMTGTAARNTVVSDEIYRNFTPITAGTIQVKMQLSITNPNDNMGVVIRDESLVSKMVVKFGTTGNLEIYDHSITAYTSLGAYSANTTYTIDIDFDNVAQPGLYRARVNGGTYSAYKTVLFNTYVTIASLRLESSATNTPRTFWVDDIQTGGGGGGASVVPVITGLLSRRRHQ